MSGTAIVDCFYNTKDNSLFIARDFFGIKPMHYTQIGNDLSLIHISLKINIADGIIERARALKSDSDLPQANQIMQ